MQPHWHYFVRHIDMGMLDCGGVLLRQNVTSCLTMLQRSAHTLGKHQSIHSGSLARPLLRSRRVLLLRKREIKAAESTLKGIEAKRRKLEARGHVSAEQQEINRKLEEGLRRQKLREAQDAECSSEKDEVIDDPEKDDDNEEPDDDIEENPKKNRIYLYRVSLFNRHRCGDGRPGVHCDQVLR
jgi:hypothetical protein